MLAVSTYRFVDRISFLSDAHSTAISDACSTLMALLEMSWVRWDWACRYNLSQELLSLFQWLEASPLRDAKRTANHMLATFHQRGQQCATRRRYLYCWLPSEVTSGDSSTMAVTAHEKSPRIVDATTQGKAKDGAKSIETKIGKRRGTREAGRKTLRGSKKSAKLPRVKLPPEQLILLGIHHEQQKRLTDSMKVCTSLVLMSSAITQEKVFQRTDTATQRSP